MKRRKSTNLIKKYRGKPSKGLFGEIHKGIKTGTQERIKHLKEEREERENRDVHGVKVGKTKKEHLRWYWR